MTEKGSKKVVVFDMDGVLVEEDSSWVTVHNYFKVNNRDSFKKYLNGEIDYCEFMKRDIALWPRVNIKTIEQIFNKTQPIAGAKDVIEELKTRGLITALATAGLDILANKINRDLNFDYIFANGLDIDKGGNLLGTGKCRVKLLRKDKVLISLSKMLNIPLSQFVAIGDSKYDIAMFNVVGLAIAFNPKDEEVKQAADIIIEDNNISKILNFL
jgi:phosphoserine phosphatase